MMMLATAASTVPTETAELPDYTGYATRTIIVLAVLVVVACGAVLMAKRLRVGAPVANGNSRIQIEAVRTLEAGTRLYLVNADGVRLLLSADPSGVSLLRSLPPAGTTTVPEVLEKPGPEEARR